MEVSMNGIEWFIAGIMVSLMDHRFSSSPGFHGMIPHSKDRILIFTARHFVSKNKGVFSKGL